MTVLPAKLGVGVAVARQQLEDRGYGRKTLPESSVHGRGYVRGRSETQGTWRRSGTSSPHTGLHTGMAVLGPTPRKQLRHISVVARYPEMDRSQGGRQEG